MDYSHLQWCYRRNLDSSAAVRRRQQSSLRGDNSQDKVRSRGRRCAIGGGMAPVVVGLYRLALALRQLRLAEEVAPGRRCTRGGAIVCSFVVPLLESVCALPLSLSISLSLFAKGVSPESRVQLGEQRAPEAGAATQPQRQPQEQQTSDQRED